jgi:hypothetical protein
MPIPRLDCCASHHRREGAVAIPIIPPDPLTSRIDGHFPRLAKWPEVLSKPTLRTPKANFKSFLNLLMVVIIRSTDLAEPRAAPAAFHSQIPRIISSNVRTFNLTLKYSEFA